ncbi:hypothetical protein MMC14_009016 [Varicellaria rhodocarpa]|nr:hypothetical protein [Varicellaria rhodocarpa]
MLSATRELTAVLVISIIPFTCGLPIGDANQHDLLKGMSYCVPSGPVPGCVWPTDELAIDMDETVSMGPSDSLVERADELACPPGGFLCPFPCEDLDGEICPPSRVEDIHEISQVTARAEDFIPPCPWDGECPGPIIHSCPLGENCPELAHEPRPDHPCPYGKDCFGPLAKRTEEHICPLDEDCSGPLHEPIHIIHPCPLGEDCIGPIDKRTEDYLCLLKGDCPEPHYGPPHFPHPCPLGEDCYKPLAKRTEEYTCPLDEECPGPFHEPPHFHHPCLSSDDCPPPVSSPRALNDEFPTLPDKRAEDFVHPCPMGEDCPRPFGGPLGLPWISSLSSSNLNSIN